MADKKMDMAEWRKRVRDQRKAALKRIKEAAGDKAGTEWLRRTQAATDKAMPSNTAEMMTRLHGKKKRYTTPGR